MSRAKGIYFSASISIYASLLLGCFPIFLGKSPNRLLAAKTNKFCSVIVGLYATFYSIFLYLATRENNPVTHGQIYNFNTLAKLLILVVTLVGILSVYAIYFLSNRYKTLFGDFFNAVATIDGMFEKLGRKLNYRLEFFECLLVNLTGPVFIACNVAMEVWNIPRENIEPLSPVLLFCHLFPFMLIHHGESQFVVANAILKKRFRVVNAVLRKLCRRLMITNKLPNNEFITSEEKIIDFCMRRHDQLCDLFDSVNTLFGFLLIIGSLIQFNTIVFAFCYCYYNISKRPISTLGWFYWVLFRIYELARKSVSGHRSSVEASSTINWINKLIIHSDIYIEEKLKIFALQLKHRRLGSTAFGLFPLDASFGFTVIGATTTYITIIYQFQVNKPSC